MFPILIMLLLFCAPSLASNELFSMTDPQGDDNGAGTIIYPGGSEWDRGDLDLVSFKAERARGGTWFIARFANKVRGPELVTSKYSNLPMKDLVDGDFYTINIDVYIDTDGTPGSGSVVTLPGRLVEVSQNTAWEKMIAVTPRPTVAQKTLRGYMSRAQRVEREAKEGSLGQATLKQMRDDVRALVDRSFFFPTRTRVRGRDLSFFVPDEFLGGPAQDSWSYLVLITPADPEPRNEIPVLSDFQNATGLMMMPFNRGRDFETFRTELDSDRGQPRVVDVLYPTVQQQTALLSNFDAVRSIAAILPAIRPDQKDVALPKAEAVADAAPGGEAPVATVNNADSARQAAMARELAQMKARNEELRKAEEAARKELIASQEAAARKMEQAEADAQRQRELLQSKASAEAQEAALQARIEKLEADAQAMRDAVAEARAQTQADAKAERAKLEQQSQLSEKEKQDIMAKMEDLQARYNAVIAENAQAIEEIKKKRAADLAQQKADLEAQIAQMQADIKAEAAKAQQDAIPLARKPVTEEERAPSTDDLLRVKKKEDKPKKKIARTIADRLRELENLRKEGLISETEYQNLRQKILEEL